MSHIPKRLLGKNPRGKYGRLSDRDKQILVSIGRRCPYCKCMTANVKDSEVYGEGKSYGGMVCLCRKCNAYVRCHHNNPQRGLGRLANKGLRIQRQVANHYFDKLIEMCLSTGGGKDKSEVKNNGYGWLAKKLGIRRQSCLFSAFDEKMVHLATEVIKGEIKRLETLLNRQQYGR